MATNLPFCFFIQFLEQLLKFLINFTLLKYVKSQRSYGFLITKELIFGFQILDLKDHFSASLTFAPFVVACRVRVSVRYGRSFFIHLIFSINHHPKYKNTGFYFQTDKKEEIFQNFEIRNYLIFRLIIVVVLLVGLMEGFRFRLCSHCTG